MQREINPVSPDGGEKRQVNKPCARPLRRKLCIAQFIVDKYKRTIVMQVYIFPTFPFNRQRKFSRDKNSLLMKYVSELTEI